MKVEWDIEWDEKWLRDTAAFHRGREGKIRFLKYLVIHPGLFSAKENVGGQWCTAIIARAIGCSQVTACSYLKEMQKLGWLRCVSPRWKVGESSRRWQVMSPEIREIHVALMGDSLPQEVLLLAKATVKELKQRRARGDLFSRLSTVKVTSVGKNDRVRIDTTELRREIKKIVWGYKGKEQTLLADFADHMFRMRHKYYEWRKRYMAWFFYKMVEAYRAKGKKTELRYSDFLASASIQYWAMKAKVVTFFTLRAELIYKKIRSVMAPQKADVKWLREQCKGRVQRGGIGRIKGLLDLVHDKFRRESDPSDVSELVPWREDYLPLAYDHFRLDQNLVGL